jgi:tetratricopeptide (TPR) repeat protein
MTAAIANRLYRRRFPFGSARRRLAATACLCLVAIVLAPDGRADEAGPAQEIFRKASPSVVTVIAYDDAGSVMGQGSGVVLGPGLVASNCHVVREAARLEVLAAPARHPARWTQADRSRDLCLLEAAGIAGPPAEIRPLAGLRVGERVHAIGNPLGFGLSASSGLIAGFVEIGGERVILSSAAQSPGSSGGGLFDSEGRLVGITTSVLSAGQNLNIALPAEWIGELSARGVAPDPLSPLPAPEPRWVDEGFAMQIAEAWPQLERHALAWREAQPTAAHASLFLVAALHNQGRTAEAQSAVREALQRDDRFAHAWHYLGVILHKQGKRAEAEQAMTRALELLPASPGVPAERARWLLEDGDAAQALPQAERAVALEPENHRNWMLLGEARSRLGRADEAIRAYRAAIGLNERDEDARNQLARLLAGSGAADAAHRALVDRAGSRADAQTWIAVGVADSERQRYAIAENAFRKATEAAPDLAAAWGKLGRVLVRMQRDDEAAPALERALQLDPDLVEALSDRSNLRGRRGELRGAIDDARRLTELAPENADSWRQYAFHSLAAQDPRTALDAYRRIDALGQAGVTDLAALGDLLGKAGDRSGAQEVFSRAEAKEPRHPGLLVNLAGFHGRAGELEKAGQYLERALAVEPRNATATNSLGYLQLLRGAPGDAVKTLERAVLLDPQLAGAWINLGHAQLRNRNLGRAIPALEKAIELAPNALDAHLYIAQAYLATREGAKALKHAETVLARQPDLAPALAVATIAYLVEGRDDAAALAFGRLRSRDPQAAERLRAQALAGGLPGARGLPR